MRWTTGSTVLPEIREAPRLWVQADWSSHSGEAGRGRRGRSGGWSSRRARSLPSCSLDAFDATSEQYQAFKKIILAKYENMKISEISNDEIWELIQELQTKKRWENMKCKQMYDVTPFHLRPLWSPAVPFSASKNAVGYEHLNFVLIDTVGTLNVCALLVISASSI